MSEEPNWQRLHPVTVIRELVGLAWNFIAAIAVSGFAPNIDAGPLGSVETLLPAAVVAFGFVRYLFTTYAITDDAVLYRRGVVVRQRTVLPRPRIQNVAIGADLVARIFSMQTLTISSAGSEGEIELAVVSKQTARELLAELTAQVDPAAPTPSVPFGEGGAPLVGPVPVGPPLDGAGTPAPLSSPAPTPRTVRYQLTTKDHLLYAFSSSTVAVALVSVIAAVVMMSFFESAFPIFWMVGLIVPVIAVLDLFGFVFEVEPRRVRVSHGLFSTQEKWAQKRRIQLVEVRRPWIRHQLGRETLAVATADVTESRTGRFDLCAPIIADNTWNEFLPDLVDPDAQGGGDVATALLADPIDEGSLNPVSRVSIRRRTIRSATVGLIPVVGLTVAAAATQQSEADLPVGVAWWWPLLLVPLVFVVSFVLARRSWAVDGWLLSGPALAVRRGRFDERLRIVWVSKVQGVFVRSTFFQRRLGLASVVIDTANLGSATVIPDLTIDQARSLADELVTIADRVWLVDGV